MNLVHLSQRLVPEVATGEERFPIVAGQQRGGGPHDPSGANELATNYNTMSEATSPSEAIRDPQGGYVGPATFLSSQRQLETDHHPPLPQHQQDPVYEEHHHIDSHHALSCFKSWLLLGSCCMLGVVTTLVGILFFAGSGRLLVQQSPNTCTSAECYKTVGNILSSLKENASPCDDFVEFACGGWQHEHPLPESKFRWGVFDNLDEQTLLDVRGLLEETPRKDEPRTIKITKTFYQACVNDSRWEEVGLKPLFSLLEREGRLPMLEPNWNKTDYDVMSSLARLRRTFSDLYLVGVTVEQDSLNTTNNLIHVSQGVLSMPREYYTPDTPLSRYHRAKHTTVMRRAGEFMLAARKQERNITYLDNLYRDVDDLWFFSVRVAEITEPVQTLDPWQLYNPMTVDQLQAFTNASNTTFRVDWLRFLQQVFEGTGINLTGAQRVVVDRPDYFTRLVGLLQNTPARTLANYLLFPLVVDMGTEIDGSVLTSPPRRSMTWSLGRRSTRTWYDCTEKVRILLPFGVGALYARHRLAPATKDLAGEVVKDVSEAFRNMLVEASWMDSLTLKEALHKLDEMKHLVAFPSHVLIDALLEEFHKGVPDVRVNDHFGNILALTAWHSRRSLLQLAVPLRRDSWPRGPMEMNAFYTPLNNAIVIPLAVLQPPLFISERLTAINYGSLGAIIGHETTHGFDNMGRMRDAHGNLKHWWTNATLRQYMNRTKCFVRQYSSYDAAPLLPPHQRPGQHLLVNGGRTVGENIADNGGLRAAWAAYRRRVEAKERDSLSLPGLEHFTDDQLFFISFARVWCSHVTPYALQYILHADVHVPSYFRVLGTLRNSPAFSQAFNCPPGSPMNPEEKCVLW